MLLSVCLFSQGSCAVWFSALSGLSSQDTNLSSIKIAVKLFFCLTWAVWPLGKGFLCIISIPGYSQPFLVIQYQNNTLYSCTPPCSSNQHCWLLLNLLSILTSCLNTGPWGILLFFFLNTLHFSLLLWEKSPEAPTCSQTCWWNHGASETRVYKPVRWETAVPPSPGDCPLALSDYCSPLFPGTDIWWQWPRRERGKCVHTCTNTRVQTQTYLQASEK